MIQVRELGAFLKRDLIEESSYKFHFITSIFGIFLSTATFFFISRLVPSGANSFLAPYGGDYFAFVIIGVAFSGILGIFHTGLPGIIREAQVTGTLEALLVTPTEIVTILFGSSLYPLLLSILRTMIHISVAILVFNMPLGRINWIGLAAVFILTAICFLSIGILSASFILVYKLGNPFDWAFGSVSGLLGGVLFPIEVLPAWLRWISHLLPITHSLRGLRLALLSSANLKEILPSIGILFLFSAVLVPVSTIIFRFALRKAKRDGSLTHY